MRAYIRERRVAILQKLCDRRDWCRVAILKRVRKGVY